MEKHTCGTCAYFEGIPNSTTHGECAWLFHQNIAKEVPKWLEGSGTSVGVYDNENCNAYKEKQ
jgi:hypothetical protein